MKSSQLRARYWRIVFFFGRVTAGFIFWEIFLPRIGLGGWSARTRSERYRRIAVRFRALAIRMGGLMIKVGQFLSARLDVLPPEITDELAGLQDEVPAEDFDAIRALAEAELGEPLADALRVVRRDADGRRIARAGAPRAPVRGGRRGPRVRRRGRQGPAAAHRADGRGRPGRAAPRGRLAAALQAGQRPRRRARARRGVRGDHARGDRLPGRGQQRRDLRRQLRGRSAHPRAPGRLGPHAPGAC